ncbi:MAG: hypothetical protein J5806_05530 [Lentisphaeria bacterium]|nr:hypothetical protein [Lentisphaeria bacterium]
MKENRILACLALLAGMTLAAAEQVTFKKVAVCYGTEKGPASAVISGDGKSVEFKGKVNYSGKFGYLIARINVEPFKLTGKSLKLKLSADYHPADIFYVKAADGSGKVAASFTTQANLSDPNTMICTPGSSGAGVKFIEKDVKADPDSEIRALTFYFCRKGPAPDFQAKIDSVELISRMEKSSVAPAPQTENGPIKLYRVINCNLPKAKPEAKLDPNAGELTYRGEVKYEKYQYLTSNVEVRPFLLPGKSISLEVQADNYADNDSFYLKCYDADNRIVASFCARQDRTKATELICTPGGSGRVLYLEKDIKAPETAPIVRLQFYCGRRGPGQPLGVKIRNLKLIDRPPQPVTTGFTRYGVGIPSAEVRNFIAFKNEAGQRMILCNPGDEGPVYLLLTEVETGKTTQHYAGRRGNTFGGVLTDDGKFVYGIGGQIHIFDLKTRKITPSGKCASSNLCATVAPDGKVYLGGAPESRFAVVDPATGKSQELGRMDDQEHYCSYLAVDKEGIVYAGIGTARANIVAWDPKTGKRTQLLPEPMRKLGTAHVVPGADGCVYAQFNAFSVKCLGGKIIEKDVRCPAPRPIKSVKYQISLKSFGDGSSVERYDLGAREIEIREKDGKIRKIKFDYVSGGLNLTSLAAGPDGKIYFSSSHPHHLGNLDPATGKITDLGFNPRVGGGNFCNLTAFNGKLYGCEYAGGRLWEYDPALPVHYVDPRPVNFGVPFAELIRESSTRNAIWRDLRNNRILFGSADGDDNELILNLKAPGPGRHYLNLQFLESGSYGTVTVKAGGKEFKFDTQNAIRRNGKMHNLGPFDLKTDKFQVAFNIKANKNRDAKNFFGIIGIELAKTARVLPKPTDTQTKNPDILGTWPNLITRPRAIGVNPATQEVVIAGFANYGLVGGGFGIWNSKTGKVREISDWLPGESCIDLYFQPDGDLVGGTSIEAPGGGHEQAKCATVFRMDWKTGKVVRSVKLPGVRHIYGVREFGRWIFAAANNGILYRIDREKWTIDKQFEMEGRALIRNPLLKTPDGKRLFLLQGRHITEIDRASGEPTVAAKTPWHLSAGGAILGDRIYFIQRENICSWKIGGDKR